MLTKKILNFKKIQKKIKFKLTKVKDFVAELIVTDNKYLLLNFYFNLFFFFLISLSKSEF